MDITTPLRTDLNQDQTQSNSDQYGAILTIVALDSDHCLKIDRVYGAISVRDLNQERLVNLDDPVINDRNCDRGCCGPGSKEHPYGVGHVSIRQGEVRWSVSGLSGNFYI